MGTTATTKKNNSNSNLKNLKILQVNARSLWPRRGAVETRSGEEAGYIGGGGVVAEADGSVENLPKIAGVTPVSSKHRDSAYKNGRGGGVIIYIYKS